MRAVADDVSVASFNQPLHKMFIQCTTSDAVAVSLANLIQPPVSEIGELAMWQVDRANMERLLIQPKEVAATDIPDVQMMPGGTRCDIPFEAGRQACALRPYVPPRGIRPRGFR